MNADLGPAMSATLQRYWGYDSFRDNQQAVIEALMSGRDAMVVMATGTGKSAAIVLQFFLAACLSQQRWRRQRQTSRQ